MNKCQRASRYYLPKSSVALLNCVFVSHESRAQLTGFGRAKVCTVYGRFVNAGGFLYLRQKAIPFGCYLDNTPTDCGPLLPIDTFFHAPAPRPSQVLLVFGLVTRARTGPCLFNHPTTFSALRSVSTCVWRPRPWLHFRICRLQRSSSV